MKLGKGDYKTQLERMKTIIVAGENFKALLSHQMGTNSRANFKIEKCKNRAIPLFIQIIFIHVFRIDVIMHIRDRASGASSLCQCSE